MNVVRDLLILGHLLGFSVLLGGCIAQLGRKVPEVDLILVIGVIIQFVTGAALVVTAEGGASHAKVGAKLGLLLPAAILVIANRRWTSVPRGVIVLIAFFVVADAAVAVMWH